MSRVNALKLSHIKAIAFDLDGVVYVGNRAVPGSAETIKKIKKMGIGVYYVTNNSGKKREYVASKLKRMGIDANVDDIFTSGYAAAVLLKQISKEENKKIFVVGSDDLKEEISQFDIEIVNDIPCDILVVGFDKDFTYEKLSTCLNILRKGAIFIACNRDRSFPVENNKFLPGCGPIVAAIEWAWGNKPHFEVGKPNTVLLEMIAKKYSLKSTEMLVVGDMIESDILMAKRFGSQAILVNNNQNYIRQSIDEYTEHKPDIILSNIKDLPLLFTPQKSGCRT